MDNCPKCLRPFNEGNSPNEYECNGTDDDEGVCEAYAQIAKLKREKAALDSAWEDLHDMTLEERDVARDEIKRLMSALQTLARWQIDHPQGGCAGEMADYADAILNPKDHNLP